MPELPEVETTLRGVLPHVLNKVITAVTVRHYSLRYPVDNKLPSYLLGREISGGYRRGKYLLFLIGGGTLMIHLGMSGSLRIVNASLSPDKHDHMDLVLSDGKALRFTDPRRFGAILWLADAPEQHPLLHHLGPEPLTDAFGGQHLFDRSRKKTVSVKSFIMDSHTVVGVGNIYANEALFMAGVHPLKAAGKISLQRYEVLVTTIKTVLADAIRQGGTTLRDFVGGDGKPGYFRQSLKVYGRGGEPCLACGRPLKEVRLAQRSTVYCGYCQR